MSERTSVVLDLITALLAVNRMTVEKAFALQPGLQQQELCVPAIVATLSQDEIATRLQAAGFERGEFMSRLMAARVLALSRAIEDLGIAQLECWIRERDTRSMHRWMSGIHGVGGTVIATFDALQETGGST